MPLIRNSYCAALLLLTGCNADSRASEKATPVPSLIADSHSVDPNIVSTPAAPGVATVPLSMNAEVVLASIRTIGADSVVRLYFNDDEGTKILDSIGTGHSPWLSVAERIAPAVDASSGESLQDAIAIALLNAPGPVLRLLASSSGALSFDACYGPADYDDSESGNSEEAIRARAAARTRLIAALRTLHDADLARLRDACILRAEGRPPCSPPALGGCSAGWPRVLGRDSSVDSVWRAIDTGGAHAGLQRMVPNGVLPAPYRERLAAGSDAWFAVAAALLTAADTAATMRDGRRTMWAQYAIRDAIADAILVKPVSVLNGISQYPTFRIDLLCDHNVWSVNVDASSRKARRDKMASALATVTDPAFAALRDACLARVLAPVR